MSHRVPPRQRYRSTALYQGCGRALDHHQQGTPYDSAQFAVGACAHLALEHLARAAREQGGPLATDPAQDLLDELAQQVLTHGRRFEDQEPEHYHPDAVAEGFALALGWHHAHPVPAWDHVEIGYSTPRTPPDEVWPVDPDYRLDARVRALIDVVDHVELVDEEGRPIRTLMVADYKTSWNAQEGALGTLQRKIQAVLSHDAYVRDHGHPPDRMELVVLNVRRRRSYVRALDFIMGSGPETIARWRRELSRSFAAYDAQPDPRPPRPSRSCRTCAYVHRCAEASQFLLEVDGHETPEDLAERYAVVDALRRTLRAHLGDLTGEGPITLPSGVEVGPQPTTRREAADDALPRIVDAACARTEPSRDLLLGLLQKAAPGVRGLRALAALYDLDEDLVLVERPSSRFTVTK